MTDMIIAVRNKLPEVPRGLFLVGENTGQTIRFDFDDEWSDYSTKTARVCIGNTRTDIDFTDNTVELPLIPSSIRYIDVGVYAGDLCTTAPARIRVIPSILGISAGSGQYDPDSPNVLPTATEVTLDDLFRLNDVSAGRWVKATVRQLLEAAGAAPQPSDDDPAANGEASPGESDEYSRADHVHPTDSALAERISDIESKKDVWDAKYGPDLGYGTIPEEALDTSTRIKIARGGIALEGLADKVDKIEGKGLSTNDYDDAAKTKVDAIPANPKYTDTVYDDTALVGRVTAIENGAVRHDISQDISDPDKATARTNIGAGTYSKPSGGIPASDLASGVIPAASSATPQALGTAAAGSSEDYSRADHVHDFNADFKTALLQLAAKVVYIDGDRQTYDALEAALTHKALSSITAVFTQGGATIYDTDSLDTLKQYLTVTAHYSDNTDTVLDDSAYTLSGTLTAGTSTITVSYGGKTTTFTATVTAMYAFYDYINYTGEYISNNSSGVSRLIRTKKYADLGSLKFDFDIMPNAWPATEIGYGILGGQVAAGNANQLSILGRIDVGRVSAFSKGVAVLIDGVPNMQAGSRVHVNLNPGKVSPTTITADSLSATSAWGTYNTVNCSIGYFGKDMVEWQNTATITPNVAIGVLKVYDLDNNLVSEYKPCKRATDDVIGIYDTVTGTFYTCATTTYAKVGHTNCVYAVGNWT